MKKTLTSTLLAGLLFVPLLASAQSTTTAVISVVSSTVTPAQIFTACSQVSIEKRDTTIADARTVYNAAINDALAARKNAEVKLVATVDINEKTSIVKASLDDYKTSVKAAQDALIKARSDAWTSFGADMKTCSDAQKDTRKTTVETKLGELKASGNRTADAKPQAAMLKASISPEVKTDKPAETKSFGDSLKEQISNFFGFLNLGKVSSTITIDASSTVSQ